MFLIGMKYRNLHKVILKEINNFTGHETVSMHTWGRFRRRNYERYANIHTLQVTVFFLSVEQHPNTGLCHLIVEVSRFHTIRHSHLAGLLWTTNEPIAGAATYTTHNKHKRQTSVPSTGFKPMTPTIKWLETYTFTAKPPGLVQIMYKKKDV
jgi:hypothetical protein